jgi:hypothetical protein
LDLPDNCALCSSTQSTQSITTIKFGNADSKIKKLDFMLQFWHLCAQQLGPKHVVIYNKEKKNVDQLKLLINGKHET